MLRACQNVVNDLAKVTRNDLEWIRDNEPIRFNTMDFIHCSDELLSELFIRTGQVHSFPFIARKTSRSIREYVRDGIQRSNKTLIRKRESDSEKLVASLLHNQSTHISSFKCMGLTKSIVIYSKGILDDENYDNDLQLGFNWLCRNGIRNYSSELHKNSNF